ncbi:MAG: hypothetical protein OEX21_10360, partial [Betaproteobacteria bacterium]|nr:hypothetical protein [Betaproteobacteria bacterium]
MGRFDFSILANTGGLGIADLAYVDPLPALQSIASSLGRNRKIEPIQPAPLQPPAKIPGSRAAIDAGT